MPEEATLNPPASTGESAPETPQFNTIQQMLADVDSRTNSAPKPPEPAKEAAPADEAPKTAPAKPEASKPEAKAPVKTDEAAQLDDDEKFLKSSTKHWRIYTKKTDALKATFAKSEAQLKAEIKALNERREQPGDAAKLAALEKQLEEERTQAKSWKEKTAQADYTRGEEYNQKFYVPYQRELTRAMQEVGKIRIKYLDENGDEKERMGTAEDFKEALALAITPEKQDAFINKTFGASAHRVVSRINELERINQNSIEATKEHALKYDAQQQELQGKTQKQEQEYNNYFSSALEGIKKHEELGKYFSGYEDDPEATQLLNQTYEEIDAFAKKAADMPPDERAAHAAVYRAQAAGFMPLLRQQKRTLAENAELKAELSKYRKSDPGNKIKPDGEPVDPQKSWGIKEAASTMDELAR